MKFFRKSFNRNMDFSMVTAYFLYFKMLETIDSIEVDAVENKFHVFILLKY